METFDTLLSTMRMTFPDGHPLCQSVSLTLMSKLFQLGEPFSNAIRQMVSAFDASVRVGELGKFASSIDAR